MYQFMHKNIRYKYIKFQVDSFYSVYTLIFIWKNRGDLQN